MCLPKVGIGWGYGGHKAGWLKYKSYLPRPCPAPPCAVGFCAVGGGQGAGAGGLNNATALPLPMCVPPAKGGFLREGQAGGTRQGGLSAGGCGGIRANSVTRQKKHTQFIHKIHYEKQLCRGG